jgi:hypothetical protein
MTTLSKQALKIIAEYHRELTSKAGSAMKGTEAAKIRSAKANAAKKAKREARMENPHCGSTLDSFLSEIGLSSQGKPAKKAKREGKK